MQPDQEDRLRLLKISLKIASKAIFSQDRLPQETSSGCPIRSAARHMTANEAAGR